MLKKLSIALITVMLILSCNKDDSDNNSDISQLEQTFFETFNIYNSAIDRLVELGSIENLNPNEALRQLALELENTPNITNISMFQNDYLYIETFNTYTSIISLNEKNEDGLSVFRGGDKNGTFQALRSSNNCDNIIENKNVLLFAPEIDDFYGSDAFYDQIAEYVRALDDELIVTVLKRDECSPEIMKTFNEYGFVIMDTHGTPDGIFIGLNYQPEDDINSTFDLRGSIVNQIGQANYDLLVSGELRLQVHMDFTPFSLDNWWEEVSASLEYDIEITSKGVRTHMPNLSNTILMGNQCFSGWASTTSYENPSLNISARIPDPIRNPIMEKNPLTYYAYVAGNTDFSYEVNNDFAIQMERAVFDELFAEQDCTGEAHLFDNTDFYVDPLTVSGPDASINYPYGGCTFKQFGLEDYRFENCGGFFIDERDGREYKAVCIGDQIWMAENLKYAGAGICYENDPQNCEDNGRLYTMYEIANYQQSADPNAENYSEQVQGICPDGWRVPSITDYHELQNFLGGPEEAFNLLTTVNWPNSDTSTDTYNFNLMPSGFASQYDNNPIEFRPSLRNGSSSDFIPDIQLATSSIGYMLPATGGSISDNMNVYSAYINYIDNIGVFEEHGIFSWEGSDIPGAEESFYNYIPCRCIKN